MRFKKTLYIFLIAIILLNISLVFATNTNNHNNIFFRIHVVANSDTIDDQLLKYTIAKKVNAYITNITENSNSKDESKEIVKENMQNILNICNDIITENNLDYSAKAYLGKLMYDEKQMNNIHMNAGIYDSLKIVIGNGQGQNWWSLIYPTTFSEFNESSSSDESFEELFSEDTKYSFGIISLLQKLFI